MRAVHHRAGGDRGLLAAGRAGEGQDGPAGKPPGLRAAAAGTAETRRPARYREMLGARRIVRKTLLELAQRTRKAGHERTLRGYMFMIRSYHAAGPKTTTRCAAGLNGMSLIF